MKWDQQFWCSELMFYYYNNNNNTVIIFIAVKEGTVASFAVVFGINTKRYFKIVPLNFLS